MKFIDLTGKKFGKLTVLNQEEDYIQTSGRHRSRWKCICECGNECIVDGDALRTGNTKSCGCLKHRKLAKDLIVQRFGKLTVVGRSSKYLNQKVYWHCKCDCGNEVDVIGSLLVNGRSKTCGCSHVTQGGFGKSRLYEVWFAMMSRCTKPENKHYSNYGGRGIKVCDEWKDFLKFKEWADKTGYDETAPRGQYTIDRVDNNGNYCPENCQWKTMLEQANNKRNTRMIEYNGEKKSILEWSKSTGLSTSLIKSRYDRGWTPEEIFTIPFGHKRSEISDQS